MKRNTSAYLEPSRQRPGGCASEGGLKRAQKGLGTRTTRLSTLALAPVALPPEPNATPEATPCSSPALESVASATCLPPAKAKRRHWPRSGPLEISIACRLKALLRLIPCHRALIPGDRQVLDLATWQVLSQLDLALGRVDGELVATAPTGPQDQAKVDLALQGLRGRAQEVLAGRDFKLTADHRGAKAHWLVCLPIVITNACLNSRPGAVAPGQLQHLGTVGAGLHPVAIDTDQRRRRPRGDQQGREDHGKKGGCDSRSHQFALARRRGSGGIGSMPVRVALTAA